MTMNPLTLADFDYALPQRLIAQAPLAQRSASRLLNASGKTLLDQRISDLPSVLQPGDLLVMNDSRVMHARLQGVKATGGQVEVLVERILSSTLTCWRKCARVNRPRRVVG
jgi:S-adenosylmethionine:tRNA ribosyltransferase-isomerase